MAEFIPREGVYYQGCSWSVMFFSPPHPKSLGLDLHIYLSHTLWTELGAVAQAPRFHHGCTEKARGLRAAEM